RGVLPLRGPHRPGTDEPLRPGFPEMERPGAAVLADPGRLPQDPGFRVAAGYEQVVASLGRRPVGDRGETERDRSPRQFIFADGAGGVERVRVDFTGAH